MREVVYPKCATCKLEHASDAGQVELGWQTFITRTSHLAWCCARPSSGRFIRSHCGKMWNADLDEARRYEPVVRTCQLCGKHVEKYNRQAGERVRAYQGLDETSAEAYSRSPPISDSDLAPNPG